LLGMNARNLSYIRPNNLQGAIRLANNKLRSKEALFKAGVPVPKIYGIVRNRHELEVFKWADLPKSFVLKPNHGGGGKGIKVIFGQNKDLSWISTEGKAVTIKDLKNHIMDIFEGFYSFSGTSDIAFFEERVQLLKIFKPYSYKGIPDIRVIVYNKIPVMAMLRLPTKESGGKANLHLGGIGLGVDVATGVTTNAVMRDCLIEKTPDTKLKLSGIKIPYWKEILEIAIKCQEVSKLGYIGVDIAIDSERGPVVLEINAHSGLSIQIANLAPLKYRLQKVSGLKVKNETHGIRIAQDLFGGEVEEEIEDISGKQVLGIIETIKITGIMNHESGITDNESKPEIAKGSTQSMEPTNKIELKAKIDTGADRSSIDEELARKLGYEKVIDEFNEIIKDLEIDSSATKEILDEKIKDKLEKWGDDFDTAVIRSSHGVTYRLLIKMNIELSGIKLISKMSVTDRSDLEFPVIIGRKSLGRFLVDPSKSYSYFSQALGRSSFSDERRRDIDGIIKSILEAEKNKQKEDLSLKERIVFYSEEIEKAAGQFNDIFSFIVPSGSGAKSCLAEINLFLENIDKKEYNPIFKYPVLKIFEKEQFKSALKKLDNICETVQLENSDLVKEIIQEAAFLSRDKINFLMFVKQKDEAKSFEYAKRIYGDINDDLVEKAEEIYQKLLENKKDEQEEDEQIVYLRKKIFNSKQIKNKFEEALNIMELQEWDIALDREASQIDVKFNSVKYELPTIVIPQKRKLNGIDLAKTIIHEIIHLKTNSNNNELGFGGVVFGRDYELYQEGLARIISDDFINDIFGAEKELPNPYYILAMNKIKNGSDFHQTFDYICELKTKEYKAKNVDGYNAEKISKREASFVCRRVFRGFRESLSKGKAYFPKDKMYLEGEILAKKMRDNNLENYLIAAKIDPYLLPLFIKLGIINKDKIKYNLDGDLETYRKLFLEW
ncbi:MAG: DUF1704 domain-containing protein, partial [Candidatus Andersenbacteria bacterium]|nr:DUF1704 domain-containing protein [Candidatus Andersenbacteria bacterium]